MKTPAIALAFLLAAVAIFLAAPAEAATKITITNQDAPGVGFNDPTPATTVGGNNGTTIGEQRRIAFQKAGETWSETLDSDVEIRIEAKFAPL